MFFLLFQLALIDTAQRAMSMPPARTVRVVGIQHTFQLGNAERADGPWRTIYARFEALYDATHGQLRLTTQPLSAGFGGPQVAVLSDTVLETNGRGGSAISYEDWSDRINASPERALALAAASPTLHVVGT